MSGYSACVPLPSCPADATSCPYCQNDGTGYGPYCTAPGAGTRPPLVSPTLLVPGVQVVGGPCPDCAALREQVQNLEVALRAQITLTCLMCECITPKPICDSCVTFKRRQIADGRTMADTSPNGVCSNCSSLLARAEQAERRAAVAADALVGLHRVLSAAFNSGDGSYRP